MDTITASRPDGGKTPISQMSKTCRRTIDGDVSGYIELTDDNRFRTAVQQGQSL